MLTPSDPHRPSGERGLYICYFGLREPLVQTQVLPYLRELVRDGPMSLLTFEPDLMTRWSKDELLRTRERLRDDGIDWHMLAYHRRPTLPATLWDLAAGTWRAIRIARHDRIQILHGRSHVGATIAVLAGAFTGARAIFDFRGLMADDYVDAGQWPSGGFLFRLVKAAERRLFRSADGVVVLTEAARDTFFPPGGPAGRPLEVIPSCVDLRRFEALSQADRETLRARLGLSDRTVFVHAGTLGGAYLVDETARLLAVARRLDPRTYALVLSQDGAPLASALGAAGFTKRDYQVLQVPPDEVRAYLHAADVGLMLIRPAFARRAMSPTKFAEYLAAGLPIVTSTGVGDLDAQVSPHRLGVALRTFDEQAMVAAVRQIETLRRDPQLVTRCRDLVRATYDLERVGGTRYRRLYQAIADCPSSGRVRLRTSSAVRRTRSV